MEDDIKKQKQNGRRPQKKIEDDLKKIKKEDNVKKMIGRHPQKNGRQPKKKCKNDNLKN
jgi:hypothetical protein